MTARRTAAGLGLAAGLMVITMLGLALADYLRIGSAPVPCPLEPRGAHTVALVLSGGPAFRRTRHAVALYQGARVTDLLFSGAGHGGDSAPRLAREAVRLGVPSTDIAIEDNARSTAQNFAFSCALPALSEADRVAIVTDRFHAARAYLTAKRQCPRLAFCSAPAAVPMSRDRRLRETYKLFAYQLLGRAAWW
ncbi:YdcF family protein [Salinisphaera sp. T31B1]|uniref:YdcF family protein n=1 Tax=Salinisphaera sp. T31B1 TaxID=727963 RepID=UPI00333E679D